MKKIKGFTLIELVLTISIIIILSVISGPIYRGYNSNAKMAEGYALLGTIRSAQEAYYGRYRKFLSTYYTYQTLTCNDEVLGIDARANRYYTAFYSAGRIDNGDPYFFRYSYASTVRGKGVPTIIMIYNRTSGITMK